MGVITAIDAVPSRRGTSQFEAELIRRELNKVNDYCGYYEVYII